jgi:prepilin-type processing-associated H-X9-DG protein
MKLEFTCSCGQRLQAETEFVGRLMRCPVCGRETTIPEGGEAVSSPEHLAHETAPVRRRPREDRFGELDDLPRSEGTSGKAIAAVVFGALSFCTSILAGVPAIVLGVWSLNEISCSRGRLGGQGAAITGIVLGSIGSLLIGPALLIALTLSAVQKVRGAAERIQSSNNLKMLTLAMMNYADTNNGRMPPAVVYGPDGKPLYSWRVLLLPYLEQDNLYHRFHLDEPWDSPNNKQLLALMPREFLDPGEKGQQQLGMTHYQVFDGPGAPFDSSARPLKPFAAPDVKVQGLLTSAMQISFPAGFPDGIQNTILIVETPDSVPWSSPQDLPFGPGVPLPKLARPSRNGFNAAYADGSVHLVPASISELTLRALITPNGGEILGKDAP